MFALKVTVDVLDAVTFVELITTSGVSTTVLSGKRLKYVALVKPAGAPVPDILYPNPYALVDVHTLAVDSVHAVSYTHLDVYKRQG